MVEHTRTVLYDGKVVGSVRPAERPEIGFICAAYKPRPNKTLIERQCDLAGSYESGAQSVARQWLLWNRSA